MTGASEYEEEEGDIDEEEYPLTAEMAKARAGKRKAGGGDVSHGERGVGWRCLSVLSCVL